MKKIKKPLLIFILLLTISALVFNMGYDIGYTYSLEETEVTENSEEQVDTTEDESIEDIESSKKVESTDEKKTKKSYKAVKYISLIGVCLLVAAMLFVALSKEDSN